MIDSTGHENPAGVHDGLELTLGQPRGELTKVETGMLEFEQQRSAWPEYAGNFRKRSRIVGVRQDQPAHDDVDTRGCQGKVFCGRSHERDTAPRLMLAKQPPTRYTDFRRSIDADAEHAGAVQKGPQLLTGATAHVQNALDLHSSHCFACRRRALRIRGKQLPLRLHVAVVAGESCCSRSRHLLLLTRCASPGRLSHGGDRFADRWRCPAVEVWPRFPALDRGR